MASAWVACSGTAPRPKRDELLGRQAGPGGLFEVIGSGYVAPQFTDASGGGVAGTSRPTIGTVIFYFSYVSNLPFAGGLLGAEALTPFARSQYL